jgi:hypothetical protein
MTDAPDVTPGALARRVASPATAEAIFTPADLIYRLPRRA